MVLKSYAKINLSLNVNKKRSNGLHDIQSIYCLVNLFDKIYIKKNKDKKDKVVFFGSSSKNILGSNNSIKNILTILRKHEIITNYYSIKVHKKIPVFAGLGGGTSNAISILKYLVKKKIRKKIFEKIVKIIGSDSRLFFHDQGYLKNLNSVERLKIRHKLNFLIIYPKIKCSTKEIYSKVIKHSKRKLVSLTSLKSKNKFMNYIFNSKNDLQLIVEKKHPVIRRLLDQIYAEKGCIFSRLTGSGSACYGLFINKYCTKAALIKLRKKHPKFWFSIAKTI